MELLFLLFTGVTIGISGAMIPGPLTFFTISATLRSNGFAGLKIILGHIILEFFFIVAILLGLQRFLDSHAFLRASALMGSIALATMGVILLFNTKKMKLSNIKSDSRFDKSLILGGLFFSAVSPGFLVWWATIGVAATVKALLSGLIGVVILTIGHWAADIGWYWSLSWAVEKGKMYLSDTSYQNIIRVFAVLLILLGLRFYFLA